MMVRKACDSQNLESGREAGFSQLANEQLLRDTCPEKETDSTKPVRWLHVEFPSADQQVVTRHIARNVLKNPCVNRSSLFLPMYTSIIDSIHLCVFMLYLYSDITFDLIISFCESLATK